MNIYLEECKAGDKIKFVSQWHYKNYGTPNETKIATIITMIL